MAGGDDCEESYGFLPCSTSLGGSLTLMAMYGYILLQGANLISEGSELLLEILDPGIIGGLVLPILGALPDAAIIVMSGMKDAKDQVAVGVGTLAGSTTLLLTLVWGGSVVLGRCDIHYDRAVNKTLTKKFDLFGSGVSTDENTRFTALIMIMTCLSMVIVQIVSFSEPDDDAVQNEGLFAGAVVCFLSLVAYCTYMIVSPKLQEQKIHHAKKKLLKAHSVAVVTRTLEFLGIDGKPNEESLKRLFDNIDTDHNGVLDLKESQAALTTVGSSILNVPFSREDAKFFVNELDKNGDGVISKDEFVHGIMKWITERKEDIKRVLQPVEQSGKMRAVSVSLNALQYSPLIGSPATEDHTEYTRLASIDHSEVQVVETIEEETESDDEEDDIVDALTPFGIAIRAATMLLGGALIVSIFSDPMVDAVSNFASASNIPAFFVAFVVTPFASNASEAVSSLQFASKKIRRNFNLTYSQIYGAVAMNNTMCLGLFFMVMWRAKIDWVFASETLAMLMVIVIVGIISFTKKSFPLALGFAVMGLYPLSLLLIFIMQSALGWQ